MLGGLLLVAAALGLTGYNMWDSNRAAAAVDMAVQELDVMIPTPEELREEYPEEMIPDYLLDPNMEMPTVQVNDHDYIGRLEIPSLGLRLPVMSEWSYPLLKVSPCRYTGSAYTNDLVIAAHNYRQHFGALKNLTIGSLIYFTDIDGNVFTYTVEEMGQLGPSETKEMIESEWDLTLFTCTLGGQFRLTVRCARVEEAAF